MSLQPSDAGNTSSPHSRPLTLLIALALLALVSALAIVRLQPPAPRGVDAPADQFSAGRARAILQELLVENAPHPAGSALDGRVRERIVAQLEALGYPVTVQEKPVCRGSGYYAACAVVKNILTELPGRENGPAVLLVAHYDSGTGGPGAADDGAAVATLLEVARIVKGEGPFKNPIIFLIDEGEELGLLGAQAFMEGHPWAERVGVVVNQEARGTGGQSMLFETGADNAWLVDVYASAVRRPSTSSLMYEAYRNMPNDTDLTVFKEAGKTGLNFAFLEHASRYHTPLDNVENLELGSLQQQGESVLGVTRKLAEMDLANPPTGDAAFMDLWGLGVLRWPAGWTIPLIAVAIALLVLAAVRLILQGSLRVKGLFWGLLAGLLAIVLPILLGMGFVWLVSAVKGTINLSYAYPLPLRAALWGGAILLSVLMAMLLARKAGFWGLAVGPWLLGALLAIVVAILFPGAAIVLLFPTLVAGVFLNIAPFFRQQWVSESAVVVPALLAGATWLPMALMFEYVGGFALNMAVTLMVGLAFSRFAPLFVLPAKARAGRRVVLFAGAVAVATLAVALVLPTYSDTVPRPVSTYFIEDRDQGSAYWVAAPQSGQVPAQFRALFDPEPQAVFPWSNRALPVLQASSTSIQAPGLQVVADRNEGEGRTVTARMNSPRGSDETDLMVPMQSLKSVSVAGYTFDVEPGQQGTYALVCYGLSCGTLDITLHLSTTTPVKAMVVDFSVGLPPGGESLFSARSAAAAGPGMMGDLWVVVKRVEF